VASDETFGFTFAELCIDFYITATEMTSGKLVLFSKNTTPNMLIADAARASASMQGLYKPFPVRSVQISNAIYSNNDVTGELLMPNEVNELCDKDDLIYLWDGGNLGNCRNDIMLATPPYDIPTLGVSLTYHGQPMKVKVRDIIMHTIGIMMMATEQVVDELSVCKNRKDIFVYPETYGLSATQFDIDSNMKEDLMRSGYDATTEGIKALQFLF